MLSENPYDYHNLSQIRFQTKLRKFGEKYAIFREKKKKTRQLIFFLYRNKKVRKYQQQKHGYYK